MLNTVVIIPTYNEIENIEAIIRAVWSQSDDVHILIVDDNSPDLTVKRNYDYIFEMDADFSHDPNDLEKLHEACHIQGADLAIGSRYVTGVNVVNWPMNRVLMSYGASKYVRLITGMKIHDTTAGFVCYKKHVLEAIDLDAVKFIGYAFQIEMKFKSYLKNFKRLSRMQK